MQPLLFISYCAFSTLTSILNKFALTLFPDATVLVTLQYLFTCFSILGAAQFHYVALPLDRVKIVNNITGIVAIAIFFHAAIWSGSKVILYGSIETFLVFRGLVPLIVALIVGIRSKRIVRGSVGLSLAIIALSGFGFILWDDKFNTSAYLWGVMCLSSIVAETILIKDVYEKVDFTAWEMSFLNNLLSFMFALFSIFTSYLSFKKYELPTHLSVYTITVVLGSCVSGFGISVTNFVVRKELSAISFSVLGVANKFATLLINFNIWEHHSSFYANIFLASGIIGSLLYQRGSIGEKNSKVMLLSNITVLLLIFVLILYSSWMMSRKELIQPAHDFFLSLDLKADDDLSISTKEDSVHSKFKQLCHGSYLRDYVRFSTSDKAFQAESPRVLIFKPRGGLADSFAGLASSVLVAMVSKRRLYIDWPDAASVLYSPLLPEIWDVEEDETEWLHLTGGNQSFDNIFSQVLTNTNLIKVSGNRGFVHHFFSSRQYRSYKDELGIWPSCAFGCLVGPLLDWKPLVRSAFRTEIEILSNPDIFSVGIHVRVFNKGGNLVQREQNGGVNIDKFAPLFTCAEQLTYRFKGKKQVKWLLISDSQKLKRMAAKKYGKKILTTDVFIGDIMHYDKVQSDVRSSALGSAVGEMWLLGFADKLVVMDRSGYGRVGAARALRLNDTYSVRSNPKTFKGCMGEPTPYSSISRMGAGL